MQEVGSSILLSSTSGALARTIERAGPFFGGLVAGDGCFTTRRLLEPYADGRPRRQFLFQVALAARDLPMLHALRNFLGFGAISVQSPRRPGWQPMATFSISAQRAHLAATVPFADRFLLPCAKREQFELWRNDLVTYVAASPGRWGRGRAICSEDGCPDPVRGRGLCRKHYYRATGY